MPGGVRYEDVVGRDVFQGDESYPRFPSERIADSTPPSARSVRSAGSGAHLPQGRAGHSQPAAPGPSRLPNARGLARLCRPASSHAASELGIVLTMGGLVGIWDNCLPERSHLQPSGFPVNGQDRRWRPARLGTAGPGTLLVCDAFHNTSTGLSKTPFSKYFGPPKRKLFLQTKK